MNTNELKELKERLAKVDEYSVCRSICSGSFQSVFHNTVIRLILGDNYDELSNTYQYDVMAVVSKLSELVALASENVPDPFAEEQRQIDKDKQKSTAVYWNCTDIVCSDCNVCNGQTPSDYYNTFGCATAQGIEIAMRQVELDRRRVNND